MAIKLIATYSKRLGLPAYSSHQFSVTIETELANAGDIEEQSARLYQTLQRNVDEQIQHPGFLPGDSHPSRWNCSDKQKQLILQLMEEHQLSQDEIESLARNRFAGKGITQLGKGEASSLIDELLTQINSQPVGSEAA